MANGSRSEGTGKSLEDSFGGSLLNAAQDLVGQASYSDDDPLVVPSLPSMPCNDGWRGGWKIGRWEDGWVEG